MNQTFPAADLVTAIGNVIKRHFNPDSIVTIPIKKDICRLSRRICITVLVYFDCDMILQPVKFVSSVRQHTGIFNCFFEIHNPAACFHSQKFCFLLRASSKRKL